MKVISGWSETGVVPRMFTGVTQREVTSPTIARDTVFCSWKPVPSTYRQRGEHRWIVKARWGPAHRHKFGEWQPQNALVLERIANDRDQICTSRALPKRACLSTTAHIHVTPVAWVPLCAGDLTGKIFMLWEPQA